MDFPFWDGYFHHCCFTKLKAENQHLVSKAQDVRDFKRFCCLDDPGIWWPIVRSKYLQYNWIFNFVYF